jgi:hypothetical protein
MKLGITTGEEIMKKIAGIAAALCTLASMSAVTATASSAATTGKACVFNAPNGRLLPSLSATKVGHVAWAFELPSGSWEFGSNNGPVNGLGSRSMTVFWPHSSETTVSWATVLADFKNAGGYTRYKCAAVRPFNASAAEQQVKNEQNESYSIPRSDCEAQVYNVLSRYGVMRLPDDKGVNGWYWVPNNWFNSLSSAGFGKPISL